MTRSGGVTVVHIVAVGGRGGDALVNDSGGFGAVVRRRRWRVRCAAAEWFD